MYKLCTNYVQTLQTGPSDPGGASFSGPSTSKRPEFLIPIILSTTSVSISESDRSCPPVLAPDINGLGIPILRLHSIRACLWFLCLRKSIIDENCRLHPGHTITYRTAGEAAAPARGRPLGPGLRRRVNDDLPDSDGPDSESESDSDESESGLSLSLGIPPSLYGGRMRGNRVDF